MLLGKNDDSYLYINDGLDAKRERRIKKTTPSLTIKTQTNAKGSLELPHKEQQTKIKSNRNRTKLSFMTKRNPIYESTSLSPILTQVSSLTLPPLTRFKQRTGLVKRTHSPVPIPNLATQCISNFISSRRGGSSIAYISNMASRFLPIEESDNPKKVSQKVENAEIKKKRKRCVSPKNSKRSRSRSPIGLKSCQDIHSSQKNDFDSPVVKVKIVSPTLRGVAESARLLRNGMFSFPTETMYSLVSFIHFRRRKDKECKTCHWESMINLKRSAEKNRKQFCHFDRPVLFVHSPSYAFNYLSFSKPKTFVYKHPQEHLQPENDKNPKDKFSAVTFSESHEVLSRLSSAFWPGPVVIYAPVKKRRCRSSSQLSANSIEKVNEESIKNTKKSSCASLISLTSESSDDQPPTLSSYDDEDEASMPILPLSALSSSLELIGDKDNKETQYVGMRCPSHPLARRILLEAYEESENQKIGSPSKVGNRIPGAIMGYSASVLNGENQSYSCRDMCSDLLSVRNKDSIPSSNKPVVHVMNGEDKREMFYVPAGQYSQTSAVSLVIDSPNRQVHILRDQSRANTSIVEEGIDIRANDVVRALHFQQNHKHSDITARAITAVLHKWEVNEVAMN